MAAQRKQEEDEATVFVRNLPLDLLGPELEEVFSEVGPVKSAAVIHNKRVPGGGPQLSRGFGFVTFALAADVSDAIRKFHGRRIRGRAMSVEPCGEKNKPASPGAAAGASPAAKSFPPKVEKVIAKDDSTEKAAPSTNAPSGETKTASAASKKQSQPTSENNGEDEEASDEVTPASKVKSKKANKLASVAEAEENASVPVSLRTLRIFGLNAKTTQKQLMKRIQKVAVVEAVSLVTAEEADLLYGSSYGQSNDNDDDTKEAKSVWPRGGMARVVLASVKDANKVMKTFNRKTIHEQTLSVRYEAHVRKGERAASSPGGGKAARVIVRNLNFKATEVELAQAFVAFGPLREVHIPTVSMPKHFNPNEFKAQSRGFGFVQFLLANDAMTAAAAAAKTPVVVCGRAVTVAMAQAKKAYDASGGDKSGEEKVDGSGAAAGSMDDDSGGEDEETKGDDNEEEGESGAGSEEEDEDDDMSDSDGSGVSDSEDDDDKDDEAIDEAADEEAELAAVAKAKLEADIAEARAAKKKAREDAGAASKDVKEGRTVFVKSLPFDAAEESLRHRFAEFGELERCLLVRDSGTGLSRGTAFVTFKEVESARSAIKASNTGKVVVLGKVVIAMAAVDRSEAKEYGKEGRERLKGQRDKRNMYLKDEGLVDGVADAVREAAGRKRHEKKSRQDDGDGSGSAQCPPGDLAKRQSAHAEKKAKLTNPLFFISPLRLSVRNVARHLTDSDLKRIFKAAADEGLNRGLVKLDDVQAQLDAHAEDSVLFGKHKQAKARLPPIGVSCVTGAKIMRDLDKTDQPSRGYGFIDFKDHASALAALRWTNNNPALSNEAAAGGAAAVARKSPMNEWPRLIVEFAVENRSKIQVQEKRRETSDKRAKQRERLLAAAAGGEDDDEGGDAQHNASEGGGGEKKMSRGMRQRERKRQEREASQHNESGAPSTSQQTTGQNAKVDREAKKQRISNNPFAAAAAQPLDAKSRATTGEASWTGGAAKKARGMKNQAAAVAPEDATLEIDALPIGEKKKASKKRKGTKNGPMTDEFDAQVKNYKAALFGKGSIDAANDDDDGNGGITAKKASAKFQESAARWFE